MAPLSSVVKTTKDNCFGKQSIKMDSEVRFNNRANASRPNVKWRDCSSSQCSKISISDSFSSGAAKRLELVHPRRSVGTATSSIFTNVMMAPCIYRYNPFSRAFLKAFGEIWLFSIQQLGLECERENSGLTVSF